MCHLRVTHLALLTSSSEAAGSFQSGLDSALVWCCRNPVSTETADAPAAQGAATQGIAALFRGAVTPRCGMQARSNATGFRQHHTTAGNTTAGQRVLANRPQAQERRGWWQGCVGCIYRNKARSPASSPSCGRCYSPRQPRLNGPTDRISPWFRAAPSVRVRRLCWPFISRVRLNACTDLLTLQTGKRLPGASASFTHRSIRL